VNLMDRDYSDFVLPPTTAVFKQIAGSSLTTYGWIDDSPKALVKQLRAPALYKDPTQIPPSTLEEGELLDLSLELANNLPASESHPTAGQIAKIVADAAGISTWLPITVVQDFRTVPYLSNSGLAGAIALHDVVVVDGKFVDILLEYSVYLALLQTDSTDVGEFEAVDKIAAAHLNHYGTVPAFYYPMDQLSPEQETLAIYNFLSAFAAVLYHELGHLYLYHGLDAIRAGDTSTQSDDVLITRTPVREDDADLSAGILLARAGFDEMRGTAMLDLLAFFVGLQTGEFTTSTEVVADFQQTLVSGLTYSSLAQRKSNLARGYRVYENQTQSSSAVSSANEDSASAISMKTAKKTSEKPFTHTKSELQVPLSTVQRSLRNVCKLSNSCAGLL
jgi:hypothetical protein